MATDRLQESNSYFAAANSRVGFVSFFDKIFTRDELDYLYIIKGGSGTGKSRLMKEISEEAKARGERVEYFYCSSDPKSLDGVILCDRKIGIIDGTAPHVTEPRLPGCFDEILNLGSFWDSRILRERREEIELLCSHKSELYQRAYSYLSVAGKLVAVCDSMSAPCVKESKLALWAQRMCKRFAPSAVYAERIRLTDGISYLGRAGLNSFYISAGEHYLLVDTPKISHIVLGALHDAASSRGISHTLSYDPLDTAKINGLYFTDASVSFTLPMPDEPIAGEDRIVNTERFFENKMYRSERSKVRYMHKCASLMTDAACETMESIFKLHSSLEEVYMSAMDFTAKEDFTHKLSERIFGK